MAKKIIVLSDGTGNSSAKVWRTNVWRTFEALDLTGSNQVAFYDDGVGTSSFKPLAILGGAFGYGLKRNVLALYRFLCRNYKSSEENREDYDFFGEDEIFAFGFSRGAFTIRVLMGLVLDQGLVKANTEEQLDALAIDAYRNYRARHFRTKTGIERPFRAIRDRVLRRPRRAFIPGARRVASIRFLGLWDTVAAYGLPVDEMTRGVSRYLWPLELPSHRIDPRRIARACHALSLDDQRTTFHPILWDESNFPVPPDPRPTPYLTRDEKVTQIWFAGVHSNVGGGYPDDSLAHISMFWIWKEAKDCGLKFKSSPQADPDAFRNARSKEDKDGRLYDSRSGLAGYYRYGPRSVQALCNVDSPDRLDCVSIRRPKIHESVFKRLSLGAYCYAPVGLPPEYDVVTYNEVTGNHEILSATAPFREGDAAAIARYEEQEKIVWSTVWRGRGIYFLTVLASLNLAIYPLAAPIDKTLELGTRLRFLSDAIRLIAIALPSAADRWVNAYAGDPARFLVSALAIVILLGLSAGLRARITDQMRALLAVSLQKPNNLTRVTLFPVEWRPAGALEYMAVFLMVFAAVVGLLVNLKWSRVPGLWEPLAILLSKISWLTGFLALVALIVLFTPSRAVAALRRSPRYQRALQSLRLRWAPIFFATMFFFVGAVFANHYVFNIRDSFGAFCVGRIGTNSATEAAAEIKNACSENKLGRCLIAPAGETKMCKDASGKDVCTGRYLLVDTRALCTPTGVYVERTKRYQLLVDMANDNDKEVAAYKSTHPGFETREPEWRLAWTASTPAGKTVLELGTDKKACGSKQAWSALGVAGPPLRSACNFVAGKIRQAFAIAVYPLKRSFDRPLGRFVLRYGETGNEENFIDPDRSGQRSLDEKFSPTRSGELFVYLNKPAFGFWSDAFHDLNSGDAKVTIIQIPKN